MKYILKNILIGLIPTIILATVIGSLIYIFGILAYSIIVLIIILLVMSYFLGKIIKENF